MGFQARITLRIWVAVSRPTGIDSKRRKECPRLCMIDMLTRTCQLFVSARVLQCTLKIRRKSSFPDTLNCCRFVQVVIDELFFPTDDFIFDMHTTDVGRYFVDDVWYGIVSKNIRKKFQLV